MDKFVIKIKAEDYKHCIIKEEQVISEAEHCIIKEELMISDNDDLDADSFDQKSIDGSFSKFNDESTINSHKNSNRTLKRHAKRKTNSKASEAIKSATDKLAKKFSKSYCSKCDKKTAVVRRKARCKKCKTLFTYTCENCMVSYRCFTDLGYHLQRKHSESPFIHICNLCGSTFSYRKGLSEHKRVHHDETNPGLPCKKCGKKFKFHHRAHHEKLCGNEKYIFKCDKCCFTAKYKTNLICHQKDKHTEFLATCETCKKSFTNRRAFMRHIRVYCNKAKALECDHCGYKCYRKDEIRNHLKWNHEDDSDALRICKYCGSGLNHYEHMKSHLERCESAPLVFKIKSGTGDQPNLTTAMKNLGRSHCVHCKKKKPATFGRTRHCNKCRKLLKFICESCSQTFRDGHVLREHLRSEHVAKVWFYQCDKCNKSFSRKKNLTTHKNFCSLNDYHAECSKCEKVFRDETSFQRHSQKCGQEPKFYCDKCPYKTYHKSCMAMHFKAKRGTCFQGRQD